MSLQPNDLLQPNGLTFRLFAVCCQLGGPVG